MGEEITAECELVSIDCNRWKKYTNSQQNELNERVYQILQNEEESMNELLIDGVLDEIEFERMSHLPYISLILRVSNPSNKRFQNLFLADSKRQYFVRMQDEIKGVMYSIVPSLVILRIYTMVDWKTQSMTTDDLLSNANEHTLTK